jgi:hypothetical protein
MGLLLGRTMPIVTTNCYPYSPHLKMMNSRSFEYLFRFAHFYDPWSLTFRSSDPRLTR